MRGKGPRTEIVNEYEPLHRPLLDVDAIFANAKQHRLDEGKRQSRQGSDSRMELIAVEKKKPNGFLAWKMKS